MTDDIKKQEVKDFLINHFGCKASFGFDCLELILRKADIKLDEILEHKIIQLKKEDYKNIFHIAHRSESKLRVKDIAKIVTSYEIIKGLSKQDYKELLSEIISNRKWDVLEVLLSKGKDPDGKPITNYFLDNIDGEILLDEVIENGHIIPSDVFSKIMDEMKNATEGIFRNKLTEALQAMKDHEFIELCAKSIESTLKLIINLVPNKFTTTLFNIGDEKCEKDLKNVINRITMGRDEFQNFMIQRQFVEKVDKDGKKMDSHQFSAIPDFIQKCVEKAIEEDSTIEDLELVSILFDKLSGDKLEKVLNDGFFERFLNKFFDVKNLDRPEFAKIADKIVMNIDDHIFKKLHSGIDDKIFEGFLSKYFEKQSAKELIEYSHQNYVKKGYSEIFKYLVVKKFKLNDETGKIDLEEALLLGKKINNILEQGCINQEAIMKIFAESGYLVILKGEDDYIDGLFNTISVLASLKSYSNTKSLLVIRNYMEQVLEDKELTKTLNKALAVAEELRNENQPIGLLAGGVPVDQQDIYKFKSLFSILDSLKNNKGVLECQKNFNKKEEELNKCIKDLNQVEVKLGVHEQFATGVGAQVYKVKSEGNFADEIFTFCTSGSIFLIGAGVYLKMNMHEATASLAKTNGLAVASKLLTVGGVMAVCLPIRGYSYLASNKDGGSTQITKVEDNQEKQPVMSTKTEEVDPSASQSVENSAESSYLPSSSSDLNGSPSEMQQDVQHQHDGGDT